METAGRSAIAIGQKPEPTLNRHTAQACFAARRAGATVFVGTPGSLERSFHQEMREGAKRVAMRNTLTLWEPPAETIEAIAAVLSSRWSAARSRASDGLFWPGTTNWLRQQAKRLADNGRVFGERYLHALSGESRR